MELSFLNPRRTPSILDRFEIDVLLLLYFSTSVRFYIPLRGIESSIVKHVPHGARADFVTMPPSRCRIERIALRWQSLFDSDVKYEGI